MMEPEWPQMTL